MCEATQALGLDSTITLAVSKRIIDHALAYGWDTDVGGLFNGGCYLGVDRVPKLTDDGKSWWAQAEGLNAFLMMSRLLPEDGHRYYERFTEMWQYICRYLIDHDQGGWYPGGLDRQPELRFASKATIWRGTYHTARALMNVIRELQDRDVEVQATHV